MTTIANSSNVTQALKRLLPLTKGPLPPVIKPRCGNLYEVLSRTPTGGIGAEVHQTRWSQKNIVDSYWVVTRSHFKCEGKHGKAWGRLYWKGSTKNILPARNLADKVSFPIGAPVNGREERIPGSLKYSWKEGRSKAMATLVSPRTPRESQRTLGNVIIPRNTYRLPFSDISLVGSFIESGSLL
jgi:small subunit ribosomal protein S34